MIWPVCHAWLICYAWNLQSNVYHGAWLARPHLVPDADQEPVDALGAAADKQLREHNRPLGVHRAVGDPVLLRERGGRVDDKPAARLVPRGGRLHLHRVVACPQGTECGFNGLKGHTFRVVFNPISGSLQPQQATMLSACRYIRAGSRTTSSSQVQPGCKPQGAGSMQLPWEVPHRTRARSARSSRCRPGCRWAPAARRGAASCPASAPCLRMRTALENPSQHIMVLPCAQLHHRACMCKIRGDPSYLPLRPRSITLAGAIGI